jgi:BirA family biotin operon repressor/biotin-[acetyl-CoA-carboxylase] ligase
VTDRLDAERIEQGVPPSLRSSLRRVTVLGEVDSTNSELARMAAPERHARVVLAECQTDGRGRRERSWHSPAGGNIYLSLGWRFAAPAQPLSALPLVVALAVAGALSQTGLQGHGIKWPNDILYGGKKLAGVLVEMQSTGAGASAAIAGIGLNVKMPGDGSPIDRPWTDLASCLPASARPLGRNQLASRLIGQLLAAFDRFERSGFESFRDDWMRYDLLNGKSLKLALDDGEVAGTGAGIGADGELLLRGERGEIRRFHSGEVRVFHD